MKTVKAGLVMAALAAQWSLADGPPVGFSSVQRGQVEAGSSVPPGPADEATANDSTRSATTLSKASLVALQEPVRR